MNNIQYEQKNRKGSIGKGQNRTRGRGIETKLSGVYSGDKRMEGKGVKERKNWMKERIKEMK